MVNIGMETEQIEYKKTTGELKEAITSIAAILNKHGAGELYFGVRNNGDVLGQVINDETLRKVSQAIKNHITPAIFPEIKVKTFDGGKQTVYVKFSGHQQPYLAYNVARIRQADEDLVMSQEMYSELLLARGGEKYSWENRPSDHTIEDIDMASFQSYLLKARAVGRIEFESDDPRVVFEKLDLFAKDGIHLLNAGAALFCPCRTNDVQMAKFATDVKVTFTDIRREDKGSIIGLSKVCEQYIIDAMDWKADIAGLERVETPEIPIEAIREAVTNSYGHRLYNNNQSNEIDVFKDRIEIHTTEKDDFVVVFYRNLREKWAEERKIKDPKIPKHQNDVKDDVLEDVLENQILKLLLGNSKLNQRQLAQKTGRSVASVQRTMKKLSERGKIERIGGKRFGHWEVK
ncbi:MAG TPA: putative DNA binding domain-containing protein [Candidatus Dorea stercoravium]|nr:putative DNA binding domain-containing protein [Candidatus Dorea stercoravium]